LAGLDGEAGLSEANFRFIGITVLNDRVAGVAREFDVVHFAHTAGAQIDILPTSAKWS